MLVATHSYKPLSARLKFLMVSVPGLTSVLPAGKGSTDRLQVITGRGYPSAWHFAWKVVPCAGEVSEGGTVVKIGRPNMGIVIERKKTWWYIYFSFFGSHSSLTQSPHPELMTLKKLRSFFFLILTNVLTKETGNPPLTCMIYCLLKKKKQTNKQQLQTTKKQMGERRRIHCIEYLLLLFIQNISPILIG